MSKSSLRRSSSAPPSFSPLSLRSDAINSKDAKTETSGIIIDQEKIPNDVEEKIPNEDARDKTYTCTKCKITIHSGDYCKCDMTYCSSCGSVWDGFAQCGCLF